MKILFLGTGEIGLPALRWLLEKSGHEIVGVVTQPDKPVGRKQTLMPPAPKVLAIAQGVPVLQPEKVRDPDYLAAIRALEPDLILVVAYGQLLPQALIDIPPLGCINLHASLLPRHRGASPIQAAILSGDRETAMTVMFVVRKLDAGDIVLQERLEIAPEDTGGTLHDKLAALGPVALEKALPLFESGEPAPRLPQAENEVTYLGKLNREDGEIDWAQPAEVLGRLIRAYDPWPGTYTWLEDSKKLKLFPPVEVDPSSGLSGEPGTVLAVEKHAFLVATGQGALWIKDVQPEGSRRMPASAFLAGHAISPGARLGKAND